MIRALVMMLLATLSLLPIIDCTSDLGSFNALMNTGHYVEATIVMAILFLNLRFVALYAALTPEPTLLSLNALYCPFLILPIM